MKSKFLSNVRAWFDSCGIQAIKYFLFVFNLIFAISGLTILIVGCVVLVDVGDYQQLIEDRLMGLPIVLIVVGLLVFLVASLGCYGAIKQSSKLLNAFAVFLLIVFIIELSVGIAAIAFRSDLESSLNMHLEKSIQRRNSADMIAWNNVQKKMMCCGITSPKDWYDYNNKTMPPSCCKPDLIDEETMDCRNAPPLFMDRYYQEGCITKLHEHFDRNAAILVGIGMGIAFIQVLGIILACLLSSAIKKGRK